MSVDAISRLRMVCSAVLGGVIFSAQSAPAMDQTPNPGVASTSPDGQVPGLASLSPQRFLQLLIARSIELQHSQLNTDATRFLQQGEASIYETTAFMAIREEGRNRQRTTEERLGNSLTSGTTVLDENAHSDEVGIRGKLPSGADISVSYKSARKSNNLIPQSSAFDTEVNVLLNLTLKQPLLRNAGRSVTETDLRVAELEHQLALQQLTQQTLKSSLDGLGLYWQLHRAQETVKLRQQLVTSTEDLLADAKARIAAGKVAASAALELQSVLLSRQAELGQSQQGLHEAQGKLSTAINVMWSESNPISTQATLLTPAVALPAAAPAPDDALRHWSPYQIALIKQRQALVRLNFAENQMRPLVDFVLSYSGTGYDNKAQSARNLAEQGTYPDWYFGVNFEFPLQGNQKAKNQYLAQSSRLTQSELEILAIRNSFANDMLVRLSDLKSSHSALESSHQEVKLRQTIFDNERQRVNLGTGSLGTLIQRQMDWAESRQRLLESQVRFEVAMATWQYAQGILLSHYQIQVSDASASEQ